MDNPTPPSSARKISDKRPAYSASGHCWFFSTLSGWNLGTKATGPGPYDTHWHPDQPTAPAQPPDPEPSKFVWLAEAPKFPGYYAAKKPVERGKLGEKGTELGTYDFWSAIHFPTAQACQDWIDKNSPPKWKATEHGFIAPASRPEGATTESPPPAPVTPHPPLTERHIDNALAICRNAVRLEQLSAHELISEALKSDAADFAVTVELMNRVLPGWVDLPEGSFEGGDDNARHSNPPTGGAIPPSGKTTTSGNEPPLIPSNPASGAPLAGDDAEMREAVRAIVAKLEPGMDTADFQDVNFGIIFAALRAQLTSAQAEASRWQSEEAQRTRERDEARAEVERIKELERVYFAGIEQVARTERLLQDAGTRADVATLALTEANALFSRHTAAVAEFLNELYAIMVDPLAEGVREVSETKAALLAAAQRDRELKAVVDLVGSQIEAGADDCIRECQRADKAELALTEERAKRGEDSERLDWLMEFITAHGTNGLGELVWSIYDEDAKSMNHLKVVSEDDVDEIKFDRATIDRAIAARTEGQPGGGT